MKRSLVVLALSLAVATAGCTGGTAVTQQQPVRVTLLIRQVRPPVEESFIVGQTVRIKDSGAVLGEITDVLVEPNLMAVPDSSGTLKEARSPVFKDVTITIEGSAEVSDAGFRFGGTNAYVNNDIEYLTPLIMFKGVITSMKAIGAAQ
jgi:hypothetical protein